MSKVIFTNGCFDILHRGHFELLKYCSTLGVVIVGLNSDDSVRSLKGPSRPFYNEVVQNDIESNISMARSAKSYSSFFTEVLENVK
jgi:D-beta-D-heptose 7-phosphate kinase/D-beta-D-heptose 1-phosphate adenosyltransferase